MTSIIIFATPGHTSPLVPMLNITWIYNLILESEEEVF